MSDRAGPPRSWTHSVHAGVAAVHATTGAAPRCASTFATYEAGLNACATTAIANAATSILVFMRKKIHQQVRGQGPEVRGQRSEVGGQRSRRSDSATIRLDEAIHEGTHHRRRGIALCGAGCGPRPAAAGSGGSAKT